MNLGGEGFMVSTNKVTVKNQVLKVMGTSTLLITKLSVLGVLTLNAGLILAGVGDRPTIPASGEDLKLTQGVPTKKFFADRLADKQCQAELQTVQTQYQYNKKALNDLINQKSSPESIDRAEEKMNESRNLLLGKTRKCGSCANQDLEKKVVTTHKKEYWYLTDGSCYLGQNKDEATLNRIYEKAVSRLKNIKKYPSKSGGFKALLEFNEIDMNSGDLLPPVEKIDYTPFYAFIGVRGPMAFGFPVGFWYIFKNDLIEKEQGNLKEFSIRFESVQKPANFPTPELNIQSASGKLFPTIQRELTLVQGMWYVNNQGYFRYYTGADFGINIPFGIDFALNTLLETLLTLTEDSVSEE